MRVDRLRVAFSASWLSCVEEWEAGTGAQRARVGIGSLSGRLHRKSKTCFCSPLPALCRPLNIGLPDAGFMALPPAEAVEAPLAEDASVEPVNPPAVGIVPSA